MGGRQEIVCLGVHATVDADEHRLRGRIVRAAPLDDRGETLELDT